uniref:Uncharacterized protein n=1 Tax=Noccaea caerulescens TaxID=107243 RepID=A0A1J3H9P7_NOCCA
MALPRRRGATPAPERRRRQAGSTSCLEAVGELLQGAQRALASVPGLHSVAQEGHHGQARVLDLRLPQLAGALAVVAGQVQGVEGTAGVAAALRVQLGVAVQLSAAHEQGVEDGQGVDGEGQAHAGVLGVVVHQGLRRHPRVASHCLLHQGAQARQHRPAAVDQLALTEALQAEHLAVGLQGVGGHLVSHGGEGADHVAGLVHGSVLVQLVQVNLQVLRGLGQAQGVEAAVAGQAAVQPGRAGGVGQPQRIAIVLAVAGAAGALGARALLHGGGLLHGGLGRGLRGGALALEQLGALVAEQRDDLHGC